MNISFQWPLSFLHPCSVSFHTVEFLIPQWLKNGPLVFERKPFLLALSRGSYAISEQAALHSIL